MTSPTDSQTAPPEQPTYDVDGVDEEDTDTTELLIAGALLLLLLNEDQERRYWPFLLRKTLGLTLKSFILRSGSDLARQVKTATPARRLQATDHADRTLDRVLADVEPKVRQAATDLFGPTQKPDGSVDEDMHNRVNNASKGLGRQIAVYAREAARQQTAMDFGAIGRFWRTEKDPKVRGSHADMEGQQRGLAEPFKSGLGNLLMFPGDPDAPPDDTFGCRCHLSYRIPAIKGGEVHSASTVD